MSMVFNFRMLSDENEQFMREYEISYDATLLDFHRYICKDLGYREDEMSSFFLSDAQWQKLREFTLADMDEEGEEAPIPMESVVLGQIIRNKHERLLYVFDLFEDRAFFLELMASKKAEADVAYPRTVKSEEKAPDQFNAGMVPENRSIFDEIMDDFSEFEGDDAYDDE